MRGVADYCGLEFEPGMLQPGEGGSAVATASAVQVRGGIRRRDVPKWQPYAAQLAPLAERLQRLGLRDGPAGL